MSSNFTLRDIHQSFQQADRDLHVLRGVNLDIQAGEIVALLGPSGSGKSCLLHISGLLEKPQSGEVEIAGEQVDQNDENRRTALRRAHIGFVYQFHNLLPEFTALENVAMPARIAGQAAGQALPAAQELLETLGLSDRLTHLPAQLSGGEQQRVAIARALINRPAIVLADEPTGSLDSDTGDKVADILVNLARRQGAGVLLATHDMELAARADRIIRLADGQIAPQS